MMTVNSNILQEPNVLFKFRTLFSNFTNIKAVSYLHKTKVIVDYCHRESHYIIYFNSFILRTSDNDVSKKIFGNKVNIISAIQQHSSMNMVSSKGEHLQLFNFSSLEHLIRK